MRAEPTGDQLTTHMTAPNLNWIANYIWGIADDVLRDVYVRGKYRDVILPMTVLRRLDAVLEPTKRAVLAMKETLDAAGVTNQDAALRQAAMSLPASSMCARQQFHHRLEPASIRSLVKEFPATLLTPGRQPRRHAQWHYAGASG